MIRWLIISSFVLLNIFPCAGQYTLTIRNGVDRYELREFAEVLYDQHGSYDPQSILDEKFDAEFVPFLDLNNNKKDASGTYWVRFTINFEDESADQFLLEAFDPKIDHISLYKPGRSGKPKEIEQGSRLNFSKKIIKHKNFLFHIPRSDRSRTYLVKIKSERSVSFRLVIRRSHRFINYALAEYLAIGLFVGLILMMILFNLNLFFSTRRIIYLHYIFFVFSNLLFILSLNGIGFQFLWPNIPDLNYYANPTSLTLLTTFNLLYVRNFLQLKKTDSLFWKIINWTIIGRITWYLLMVFTNSSLLFDVKVELIPFIIAFIACLRGYRKEESEYRMIIVGYSFLFLGFVIYALWFSGILRSVFHVKSNLFFVYCLQIATILEMFFFSIAISLRMRNLFKKQQEADKLVIQQLKEKEELTARINEQLEEKVQERTKELELKAKELDDANKKLQALTEEVSNWNVDLDLKNRELSKGIDKVTRSKIMLKEATFEEFSQVYPDEHSCYKFIEEIKWRHGYTCRKCGNDKYNKGNVKYSRRCTKCNYDESVTVNTLFHRIRFPVTSAFYMLYLIVWRDGNITIDELQEITGLRRATAWSFKKKVAEQLAIVKQQYSGSGKIQWDELIVTSLAEEAKKK